MCVPLRMELVRLPLKFGVFPFRLSHDVTIAVAEDIGFDPLSAQELRIVVGVIRDVADVEDPHTRTPLMLTDPPHSPNRRTSFFVVNRTGLVRQICSKRCSRNQRSTSWRECKWLKTGEYAS